MKQVLKYVRPVMALGMCVIMSTAFTSCKDDDDSEPESESIIGTWRTDVTGGEGSETYDQYIFSLGSYDVEKWRNGKRFYHADGSYTLTDTRLLLYPEGDNDDFYYYTLKGNLMTLQSIDYPNNDPIILRKVK